MVDYNHEERSLKTNRRIGLIEYVDAPPLAKILTDYRGNMQAYLRAFNPDPEATESYGINAAVMDAYVRSCAGYCVITYILGIGDRHLDNLLLSTDGKNPSVSNERVGR
jgi:phosphatidylinositol 3-kinase